MFNFRDFFAFKRFVFASQSGNRALKRVKRRKAIYFLKENDTSNFCRIEDERNFNGFKVIVTQFRIQWIRLTPLDLGLLRFFYKSMRHPQGIG